ncbi:MAG: histidine--tRNA ligase [Spirochaetes bacterium]|nr:histidine--tRNA ligase [Spirochaetota bacterium]
MIQKPPGIDDIFPDKIPLWNLITGSARQSFRLMNYREIIIPVMEYTDVFARGIGNETDIVSKEMFTFEDRGGRNLTLRPEGTASVVRAYAENGEYNRLALCKLFYIGPMFRAERPQKGRLRQFNQFGAELFGDGNPYYDYEVISMMEDITDRLGIRDYTLIINSIGCPACRPAYIADLKKYFSSKRDLLCDDCKRRLEKNPLRILDCKKESCSALKSGSPPITGYICGECGDHHSKLKAHLDSGGTKYTEDPLLVRGLDYYTRTTFEFVTEKLGGQNAFAAGGRYDNLVEQFGGRSTPAVGFAAGIERIMLMLEGVVTVDDGVDVYLVHVGGEALEKAVSAAKLIRKNGYSADLDPNERSFKAQFKRADREKAKACIVIGQDEISSNNFTVKRLDTGEQVSISESALIETIEKMVAR